MNAASKKRKSRFPKHNKRDRGRVSSVLTGPLKLKIFRKPQTDDGRKAAPGVDESRATLSGMRHFPEPPEDDDDDIVIVYERVKTIPGRSNTPKDPGNVAEIRSVLNDVIASVEESENMDDVVFLGEKRGSGRTPQGDDTFVFRKHAQTQKTGSARVRSPKSDTSSKRRRLKSLKDTDDDVVLVDELPLTDETLHSMCFCAAKWQSHFGNKLRDSSTACAKVPLKVKVKKVRKLDIESLVKRGLLVSEKNNFGLAKRKQQDINLVLRFNSPPAEVKRLLKLPPFGPQVK